MSLFAFRCQYQNDIRYYFAIVLRYYGKSRAISGQLFCGVVFESGTSGIRNSMLLAWLREGILCNLHCNKWQQVNCVRNNESLS